MSEQGDTSVSAAPDTEVAPPGAPAAPPFGGYAAPPPPAAYHPRSRIHARYHEELPPRPSVAVAAAMVLAGGAMLIAGSLLKWYSTPQRRYTGFTPGGRIVLHDGPFFVALGVVVLVLGGLLLAMRRVVGVAVAALAVGLVALWVVLDDLGDLKKIEQRLERVFSHGVGLWVVVLGAASTIAGALTALVRRRAWPRALHRD